MIIKNRWMAAVARVLEVAPVALARSRMGLMGVCVGLLALYPAARAAQPSPTAFTYHGQLDLAGDREPGPCDIKLVIYDAPAGGHALAVDEHFAIEMQDGLFTIDDLDFGIDVLDGQPRWLEIQVRPSGRNGAYGPPLEPRGLLSAQPDGQQTRGIRSLTLPDAGVVIRAAGSGSSGTCRPGRVRSATRTRRRPMAG